MVQDGLCVGCVGFAVHVDVGLDAVAVFVGLAVDVIGGVGADEHRSGILQHAVAAVAGDALGEDVGAESEFLLAFHRGDGEGEVILADPLGIVAQLYLDLAVLGSVGEEGGVLVHQNVGLCAHSVRHIGMTGANANGGPVVAVSVVHRVSGGHQQGVNQLTLAQTGLLAQVIFPDVLAHNTGHTVDLRRGHGGTRHQLVLVVTTGKAAVAEQVLTGNGVDGAAGSQNFRLHNQRTGHAVGGESRDLQSVAVRGVLDLTAFAVPHGAGVVQHVAFLVGNGSGIRLDGVAVRLQDGDSGGSSLITGEVHGNVAGLVVDNHNCHGTLRHSRVRLCKEGGAAAIAHGNLAAQDLGAEGQELVPLLTDMVVVVNADAVNQNVFQLFACQRGDGLIAIAAGFDEENMAFAKDQGHTGPTGVV